MQCWHCHGTKPEAGFLNLRTIIDHRPSLVDSTWAHMVTFASTEHLNLRAYRDSDLPHILALWNDPRVQRVGTSEYARPRTAKWATDILAPQIEAAITAVVLELKEPCTLGDNAQQDALSRKSSGAGEQDAFVGYALLQIDHVRGPNRDATLAIALAPRCWGRGFGTEVVQWIVGHGFGVLGMHRISLAVLEGNDRAIALYKRV
jgi:RimJ/RimL family protein N-acetyltransferase